MKLTLAIAAFLGLFLYGVGAETVQKTVPQTLCPVMGNAINKDIYVDYQGERVYFCCQGCPPLFNKDPKKYVDKMKEEGVTLEKMGTPVGKDAAVTPKKGCCQKKEVNCQKPCPVTGKKDMKKEDCRNVKCPANQDNETSK